MARKKVAKTIKAKKPTQSKTKTAKTNLTDMMEKSFKEMPGQLIAQCNKDATALKQQEKKLSTELKKAQALTKAIEAKCGTLAKAKATATVKKQLAAAKQGHSKANNVVKEMTAKMNSIQTALTTLSEKQSKFAALNKELAKFDGEWAKRVKEAARAAKAAKQAAAEKMAAKAAAKNAEKARKQLEKKAQKEAAKKAKMTETMMVAQEQLEAVEEFESESSSQ